MRSSSARPGTQKAIPVADAKARVLELLKDGYKVAEACAVVQRSSETYRDWMKKDAEFKTAVQGIREVKTEEKETGRPEVPDFETFCRDWLKQPLFPHQLRMLDVIEGRAPRDLHESMDYEPGLLNRVLINVPPEHAKSTTFTVNYSVWLIHKNPDVRIVLMSQGKDMAKRFLYEIKQKLTSSLYREMHMRFGPAEGWKDPDNSWSQDAIYVRGKGGEVVQKDPTVQALGLGGQIYGARADFIFLDDLITSKNASEISKQTIILEREIESRLPSEKEGGGLLAILGTRVAPNDLYRTLIDETDFDGNRVWTYLRQPAVLDYGNGESKDWTTLWNEKWDGPSLVRKRRKGTWNLIYQQMNVSDDMTFSAEAIEASMNRGRIAGPLSGDNPAHRRPEGMTGLYVVGGLDPAAVGNSAMIVSALDRTTEKRYILDGFNKAATSPAQLKAAIRRLTDTYRINEWVIETNAFQKFLTLDQELVQFLQSRGCKMTPHYTTANKHDEDWGVQTMAPLFESCGNPDDLLPGGWWKPTPDRALIELPAPIKNEWVNDLVQQLTTWQPSGMAQKVKTDLVMALWFTHIAHSRILQRKQKKQTHLDSPFMSPSSRGRQQVISLAALRREKQELQDRREGVG